MLLDYDRNPSRCNKCHEIIGFLKFYDKWCPVELFFNAEKQKYQYEVKNGIHTTYHKCKKG